MKDLYTIDLTQFSLDRLRGLVETGEVLPGRRIIKEKVPERFAILASMGIENLQDIVDALKTKKRLSEFAQASGLPEEYLVILRREVNAYLPNPVSLARMPGVDADAVERLAAVGIKHSKHLFSRAQTGEARAELAALAGVSEDSLAELVKLSDLVRVSGVGPVFARLLYEAGVDTIEALAQAAPEDLLERVCAINKAEQHTKVMPTLRDMRYCLEMARDLPVAITFN
jgi:predicted flap endonuclease-1-like 5' DNA nuclease